jgi:hypothetical protein
VCVRVCVCVCMCLCLCIDRDLRRAAGVHFVQEYFTNLAVGVFLRAIVSGVRLAHVRVIVLQMSSRGREVVASVHAFVVQLGTVGLSVCGDEGGGMYVCAYIVIGVYILCLPVEFSVFIGWMTTCDT